jgi:hypothetical protein
VSTPTPAWKMISVWRRARWRDRSFVRAGNTGRCGADVPRTHPLTLSHPPPKDGAVDTIVEVTLDMPAAPTSTIVSTAPSSTLLYSTVSYPPPKRMERWIRFFNVGAAGISNRDWGRLTILETSSYVSSYF